MALRLAQEVSELEKSPLELSIIVPCLNEEENLEPLLTRLEEVRATHNLTNFETLLLDDSSTDRTFAKSIECLKKFPELRIRAIRRYEPRRGYGAIIRFGIAHARGQYCVPVSADDVDPIELIPVFLERVRAGVDVVQCSRYLREGDKETIPFKFKFWHSIWRALLRVLLRENIRDTTYPFRIFRRTDILALGLFSNRFSISPEIFFKLFLSGARIEYLARGQGIRQRGKSNFVFRREGPRYFHVLMRAWLHRLGILWF